MAPPSFRCSGLQICPFTMGNTWCFQMVFFPFQSRGEKPDVVLVTVRWATALLITQLFLAAVSEWFGSLQQVLVVTAPFKCRREYCMAPVQQLIIIILESSSLYPITWPDFRRALQGELLAESKLCSSWCVPLMHALLTALSHSSSSDCEHLRE